MEHKYRGALFSPAQEIILRFFLKCTRSQQDLMLTEANKLTCRPRWRSELTNCFAVLTLHRPWSPCHSKSRHNIRNSIHYLFYVWYCIRSIPLPFPLSSFCSLTVCKKPGRSVHVLYIRLYIWRKTTLHDVNMTYCKDRYMDYNPSMWMKSMSPVI